MEVRVVTGCYEHTMLSMEHTQALVSQNEPSGYPTLYLIKHIHSITLLNILGYTCLTILRQDCCLILQIPPTSPLRTHARTPSAIFQVSVASSKWETAQN